MVHVVLAGVSHINERFAKIPPSTPEMRSGMAARPLNHAAWLGGHSDVVSLYPRYVGEDMSAIRSYKSQGISVLVICPDDCMESRIAYLDGGADMCLPNSVHPREIEASLISLIRRNAWRHGGKVRLAPQASRWRFDDMAWELVSPEGQRIALTAIEYRLVRELWSEVGQPVTRERLAAAVGKPQNIYTDRSLDAVVSRLRRKIEMETGAAPPIRAARNIGYAMVG